MYDPQIEALINLLKASNQITSLEKDILDTYHELCKQPFDMKSAYDQMKQNELKHPDVFIKVRLLPTTGQKPAQNLTVQDIQYVLRNQLSFLIEKRSRQ